MSPTQFHDTANRTDQPCPTPLKIKKDSHFIRKSPCSSTSSSSTAVGITGPTKPQQHRHPVIIYTHSPKVIHTHPRDFMALVQKLTGMSRKDAEQASSPETGNALPDDDVKNSKKRGNSDDNNESSSVITTDDQNSDGHVNSCFLPPMSFDTPPPPPPSAGSFLTNVPVFMPNSADLLCTNQPFYNYSDSFYFAPNMRTTLSSSSTLDDMNEFPDY